MQINLLKGQKKAINLLKGQKKAINLLKGQNNPINLLKGPKNPINLLKGRQTLRNKRNLGRRLATFVIFARKKPKIRIRKCH